ncbi:MAG: hypothetical protein K6U03_08055 [Firmicutes bacterium]|nr:hypothetical protein [Bacillota bacterium]
MPTPEEILDRRLEQEIDLREVSRLRFGEKSDVRGRCFMKERILLLQSEMEDLNRRQANIYDKFNQSWERYQANGDHSYLKMQKR